MDFPGSSSGKESAGNAGDPGLILGSETSLERGMATHSMPHNLENDHGSFYSCLIMYPTHRSLKLSLSIIAVEVKQTFLNNASSFCICCTELVLQGGIT